MGDDAMSDTQQTTGIQRTIMTNIDIPFGRLIVIFIKFGLAAIPATIVVSIVFMLIVAALSMIFGTGFMTFMGRGPTI
jgi:hypothetical protein